LAEATTRPSGGGKSKGFHEGATFLKTVSFKKALKGGRVQGQLAGPEKQNHRGPKKRKKQKRGEVFGKEGKLIADTVGGPGGGRGRKTLSMEFHADGGDPLHPQKKWA